MPTLLLDMHYKKNYDFWQGDFVFRYGSFVLFVVLNYIMSREKPLKEVKKFFERKATRDNLLEHNMT